MPGVSQVNHAPFHIYHWAEQLKYTFLLVPCKHGMCSSVKVVHEEYNLHYTQAAGVLELAYTRIELYTGTRSG